jgi:O-antigen/teichoic acid export membrane protein
MAFRFALARMKNTLGGLNDLGIRKAPNTMSEKPSTFSHQMLSGSVLRTVQLFVAAAVSLFLMPFIVHHIGDRLYGFWSLAAAFVGYYGVLDIALGSAVSQYICVAIGRGDQGECRKVFNAALRINLILGGVALLATAVLVLAAPWFSRDAADAALFRTVIAVMGVNVALTFPAKAYGGVLDAELRFDLQSWLGFLSLAMRTGLTVWVLLAGGGLLGLAWATLLSSLPQMGLQVWFARRQAIWARMGGPAIESEQMKSIFSYSAYTGAGCVADTLRFQIDPLVISGFVGLAAVTHYRVASLFINYFVNTVIRLIGPCRQVLSRLHGARDQKGLEKVFFFATKASLCISVFVAFSLIFWGKPFIIRWMGPAYADAYWPLAVLSLAVLLDVGQNPSVSLLYATEKHRFYTYVNAADGVLNLAFSLALARPLGLLGVALGTLIAAILVRVIAQPLYMCKATGLPFGSYLKFLGSNLLRCGSVMGVAVALSAWGLKPDYVAILGSAIIATAIYAIGCWLLVFTPRERAHLWAAVKGADRKRIESAGLAQAT